LGRRLTAFRDEQTSALGLTVPQAQLLRMLDAPLAMNQIASRLHCDASNITGIVDRLEARGLVARGVKPGDRRIKVIELTAEGKRVRKKVAAMSSSVPGLSQLTKSEQKALDALLTRALA
jgi:DNA-binding MarR family transcriptional regulator